MSLSQIESQSQSESVSSLKIRKSRLIGLIWRKRWCWKAISRVLGSYVRYPSSRPSPILCACVHVYVCVRARVCVSLGKDCGRLGCCFNRKRSIRHRNRGICYRDDRPTIFASPFLSGELANRRDVVCFPDGMVRCLHSGKLPALRIFFSFFIFLFFYLLLFYFFF